MKTPDRRKRVMRSGAPMRRSVNVDSGAEAQSKASAHLAKDCATCGRKNWQHRDGELANCKKSKGGRPKKDNVRLVAYVSARVGKLFQDEAESRGLTLGELFEEICASRVTLNRH